MYCVAWAFGVGAVVFLFLGAYTNPSLVEFGQNLFGIKPSPQIEFGSWSDDVPFVLNSSVEICFVRLNYTIYGNDLSVGQPITLIVNASIVPGMGLQGPLSCPYVTGITIEPQNIIVSPFVSDIWLGPRNNSVGKRIYSGSGLLEFNSPGPLVATVDVVAVAKTGALMDSELPKTVVPTIIIGPSGSGEMAFYENQNLSLTWFILFFASIDIAVTLYDHSYEDVDEP